MLPNSQQNLVTQNLNDSSYVEPSVDAIVPKDTKGHIILNKSIKALWQEPLRLWDYKNEMLTHIHIVKTSGTSFDYSLLKSLHKDGCGITCPVPNKFKIFILQLGNGTCPSVLNSYCCNHFDWTQVKELEESGIQTGTGQEMLHIPCIYSIFFQPRIFVYFSIDSIVNG